MIVTQHHALPISRDTIYLIVITAVYVLSGVWNIVSSTRRLVRSVRKIHADWDARELVHIATRDAQLLRMRIHYDESLATMRSIYDGSVVTFERTTQGYDRMLKRLVRDIEVGALRSAEDYIRELQEFVAIIPPPVKTN
jgi:hypothetical protein